MIHKVDSKTESPRLQIDFQDLVGTADVPSVEDIERWLNVALQVIPTELDDIELSILVTSPEQSQQLNKEYRGKDKPTNVLSFPADMPDYISIPLLGDMVICHDVVKQEAQDQDKRLVDHWAHMVIHGLLHLMGYDHEIDSDAEIMESLEIKALARLGIDNPYESK